MARQYQLKKGPRKGVSGIDYLAELNEQQYAAVSSSPGPALVIAGAGSGKTRTLTYRVAYLLDQGVDPKSLLLLTFTNKAAREMMERVRELISLDLSELGAGLFTQLGIESYEGMLMRLVSRVRFRSWIVMIRSRL